MLAGADIMSDDDERLQTAVETVERLAPWRPPPGVPGRTPTADQARRFLTILAAAHEYDLSVDALVMALSRSDTDDGR